MVDSGSVDRTVEIARANGASGRRRRIGRDIGQLKSRALKLARRRLGSLSLDADEWIEPGFGKPHQERHQCARCAGRLPESAAVAFLRQGVEVRGWSSDYVVRLFQRGQARFSDDVGARRLIVDGPIRRTGYHHRV